MNLPAAISGRIRSRKIIVEATPLKRIKPKARDVEGYGGVRYRSLKCLQRVSMRCVSTLTAPDTPRENMRLFEILLRITGTYKDDRGS